MRLFDKKWFFVLPAVLGTGSILMAVFAPGLGIDGNATWGGKRVLALILGLSLLLFSAAVHWPRQQAQSAEERARVLRVRLVSLAAGVCTLLVIAAYVWIISLGRWSAWLTTSAYYDRLATSFQHGRIDIEAELDPALLQLPNPYDPEARKQIRGLLDTRDMSLYNGKVYLYFGAGPAVLLAVLKYLYSGQIGDAGLTFAFLSGLFIFEALLLLHIWRRFFSEAPGWTVVLGLLVIGLIHPVAWMLIKPRVYEVAIAAGQCFLAGGFFFALAGLGRESKSVWRHLLAGSLWALAAGTRPTLAIPVVFLSIMVLYRMFREHQDAGEMRSFGRAFAAMFVPLAVGAVTLCWYNWARFGSIFETGFRYALAMLDLHEAQRGMFSPVHALPNLYVYFLNPPALYDAFPFFRAVRAEAVIARFRHYSPLVYNAERGTGILYYAPFMFLALIPAAYSLAMPFGKRKPSIDAGEAGSQQGLLKWTILSLLGALALGLITLLSFYYATVRYVMEITPFAVTLAMIGFWQGYLGLRRRKLLRALYELCVIGLAVASILVSVTLAFSNDADWIRENNGSLLPQLVILFNTLRRAIGF